LTLRDVAVFGFMAAGSSVAPLVINAFGASTEATWQFASCIALVLFRPTVPSGIMRRVSDQLKRRARATEVRVIVLPKEKE
jgi:hypothetical protein